MRRLLTTIFVLCCAFGITQETKPTKKYVVDVSSFYGSILLHNPDISHLVTENPSGFVLGYSRKRYGNESWESEYGYPDTGFSFVYQNMNNRTLGDHYGLFAHYNFYFLKRNLQFRIGQGISYNTNPYDRNQNFRNNAYGSHLLSATLAMFNYHKEDLFHGLGIRAGLTLVHYSNGNFKAPNTSTNTMAFNFGLTYDLDRGKNTPELKKPEKREKITEPVKYNLVLRGGLNESDVIGLGQYGFWIFSAYADKRLGRKSAIQLGSEVFFSNFLQELIRFQSISFPEMEVDADTDFKRAGIFVGHELFVNKMSVITQLGYYVYYPFEFESRVYNRIGLKRYFGNKLFGAVTLKSHGASAEAIEFGVGVRL